MTALFLAEGDVDQLVDIRDAIDVTELAFRHLADGTAVNVPRTRAPGPGIVLHSMSASASYLGRVGWKQYTTTREGARFHVGLYDQQSGRMLALMEANRLGQLRTGATSGVAAKWLARQEAAVMGLFGAGWQAETQLSAIAQVRQLQRVNVYSRREPQRQEFAERMSDCLQLEVVAVDDPRQCVAGCSIVVTATSSSTPVFDGSWLAEGTMLAAVGSNWLRKAEIDVAAVRRASLVVCDSVQCCEREAGDLSAAQTADAFHWREAIDLADVVAGDHPGRTGSDQVVLFKSVGLGIEDVALASRIFDLAQERGIGRELPF